MKPTKKIKCEKCQMFKTEDEVINCFADVIRRNPDSQQRCAYSLAENQFCPASSYAARNDQVSLRKKNHLLKITANLIRSMRSVG